jgi:hypothetical protein
MGLEKLASPFRNIRLAMNNSKLKEMLFAKVRK